MPYNSYYPVTYQNPYYQNYQAQPIQQMQQVQAQQYQQQIPQAQQQTQANSGVNWVQGEAGARSWLMAPNTTVMLMDSEADVFYLKSTDASGMPLPLRIFDYTERRSEALKNDLNDPNGKSIEYATKEDLNALQSSTKDLMTELKKQIKDEVTEMFSGGTVSFTAKTKRSKEVQSDE